MDKQKQNATEDVQQGGLGRVNRQNDQNVQQEQAGQRKSGESRDISEVDQQEGNMDNGVLGGNFGVDEGQNRQPS